MVNRFVVLAAEPEHEERLVVGAKSFRERAVSRVLVSAPSRGGGKQRSLLIGSWTHINADTSQARLLATATWNVRST